ncbi:hypothetical protein C4D60_Mb02t03510 [Musa balbisiana]|uniref:Uncharacterized protein n=1 Tax=Musa balbisiana TaxID=52838 RepID=A0A4S8I881_MUSBA|nr:hypothetical protein C4D60_Mb02t03510 [Musa balbisiana]
MFREVGEPWPVLIPDEEIHLSIPGTRCVFPSVFFYFLSKAFLHTDPVRVVDYNLIEISIPPHLRLRDLPLRLLEMLEITKFRVVIQIYTDTERQHVPHTCLGFEKTVC